MWRDIERFVNAVDSTLGPVIGPVDLSRVATGGIRLVDSRDQYVLEMDAPGCKASDIDVDLEGSMLAIKATRYWPDGSSTKTSGSIRVHRADAGGATCVMEDGVVRVTLPRTIGAKIAVTGA